MAWSGAVSSVVLLVVTWASGESFIATTLFGWAMLLGLALFSHAGGQSLIAYSLAHLPAAMGSVGLLSQPVLAALLAWVLVGEALGSLQILGGIAILAGIFLARRGSG